MMILLEKIKPKHILILILILAAFMRLYRLDYPNKYVFDEVYHAFTAKEYLAGHKEAWEIWSTPPPGVAYEWTHPPLAKEIMAISMFLVNTEEAWAWRLPGALFGVLSVYIIYLLGRILLKSEVAALVAAFVFSVDGLNFVQSRTGMNDIYYVTFMLLALLFLLKRKYLWSSVFFGLSLSSKWAALYLSLLIFFILLKDKQLKKLAFFIFLPPIIYLLSYLPFFIQGHSASQFIELQQQIWWYHTGLKATHPYTSPWWSWPLNLYPIWYFVDYQKDNLMANIFASGNPVLFWSGLIAIMLTIWRIIKQRSWNLIIIVLGFLTFWLPWSLSPRIMFLYHFSPSVPFLSLALGHELTVGINDRNKKKIVITLLILIFLAFIWLYPFLTGISLPRNFIGLFFATNMSKNPF